MSRHPHGNVESLMVDAGFESPLNRIPLLIIIAKSDRGQNCGLLCPSIQPMHRPDRCPGLWIVQRPPQINQGMG